MFLGAVAVVVAFALPAVAHGAIWQVLASGMLTGAGIGLAFAAMSNAIIESVPAAQTGEATSVNTIARTIGSSIGTAVVAAVITSQQHTAGPADRRGVHHRLLGLRGRRRPRRPRLARPALGAPPPRAGRRRRRRRPPARAGRAAPAPPAPLSRRPTAAAERAQAVSTPGGHGLRRSVRPHAARGAPSRSCQRAPWLVSRTTARGSTSTCRYVASEDRGRAPPRPGSPVGG